MLGGSDLCIVSVAGSPRLQPGCRCLVPPGLRVEVAARATLPPALIGGNRRSQHRMQEPGGGPDPVPSRERSRSRSPASRPGPVPSQRPAPPPPPEPKTPPTIDYSAVLLWKRDTSFESEGSVLALSSIQARSRSAMRAIFVEALMSSSCGRGVLVVHLGFLMRLRKTRATRVFAHNCGSG